MGKCSSVEPCQFSHPERRGTLSYPPTPGTRCRSEEVSGAGSLSPRRLFSPSRGFSDRDEADPNGEDANPLDFDFCGSIRDVTEPRHPLTQKKRLVPYIAIHRDKESLLEEVELLLNAFQDQRFHFLTHKMHHEAVEAVNSKLERQIEYLETSGLEAARSGTLTKLKAKLKGSKFRIMETQMACAANAVEIRRLRMNAQVAKSQEAKVQREEYATEVRRQQKSLRKLRILYKKVLDENIQAARVREGLPALRAKNKKLEASVAGLNKTLQDMTAEIADWKSKRAAAQSARSSDESRYLSLQGDNKSLIDLLVAEKLTLVDTTRVVNELGHQVRVAEKEARDTEALANEAGTSGFLPTMPTTPS